MNRSGLGVSLVALVLASVAVPRQALAGAAVPLQRLVGNEPPGPVLIAGNAGQWPAAVKFGARAAGEVLWITDHSLWITKLGPAPDPDVSESSVSADGRPIDEQMGGRSGVNLRLTFSGHLPDAVLVPSEPQPTRLNYLIGSDAKRWRPNVRTYGAVTWRGLYPGVSLTLTGVDGDPALVLHGTTGPGEPVLHVRVDGATRLLVTSRGRLVAHTAAGEVALPIVVSGRGALRPTVDGTAVSFGPARAAAALPTFGLPTTASSAGTSLRYGTFLGGSDDDLFNRVAVGPDGSTYVVGRTLSEDFPTTPGAFDPSANGSYDAFVSKLDPTGATLQYSTYLGGTGWDDARSVAVGPDGSAYLGGLAGSENFPTTPGAFDRTYVGGEGFVATLDPQGSALTYSTFLGGSVNETVDGIALGEDGSAYVTGQTQSSDFPTTPGAFDRTENGSFDAFVTAVTFDGSDLVYCTYLGGTFLEDGLAIVLGPDATAYVTGYTQSSGFPTTPGAFDVSFNGGDDVFATRVSADGASLVSSTFVGGGDYDQGYDVALDAVGHVFLAGSTLSSDFPITAAAYDPSSNGLYDSFVTKLDPTLESLAYGTFLGGTNHDRGHDLIVDPDGSATVTGNSQSGDFPTTPGALRRTMGGSGDAFVSRFDPSGARLVYSTFLGGTDRVVDVGWSIAPSAPGVVTVVGDTQSTDFPTTAGAYDRTYNGGWDAYAVQLQVAQTIHVKAVDAGYRPAGRAYWVACRVTVVAVDGAPVGDATVTVELTAPDGRTVVLEARTGPQGAAVVSRKVTQVGTYTFTVRGVSKPPFVYDSSQNVETSDSVTIP